MGKKTSLSCPCGPIEGQIENGIRVFKGIRYASASRWEYPQEITSWGSVYDATRYGNCSWQPRSFGDEAKMPDKAFYHNEFRRGEKYTYSEDCLNLNIWAPIAENGKQKLPVILYIHGGGFLSGCGFEKPFNAPIWPSKGVLAVTINYRLGPLGFAALPELASEAGIAGNYGLYDQMAALNWVKHNIEAFGGDPENITLMGQSAGAMSVQQLVNSPLAQTLFAKAVMSSGGGAGVFDPSPRHTVYPFWYDVAQSLGGVQKMRSCSVSDLFGAWEKIKQKRPGESFTATSPIIDGALVVSSTAESLRNKSFAKIPYMVGSNSGDLMPPALFDMAYGWAEAQAKEGRPSYMYHFSRQLPGDAAGAWHSADLWYWFGTMQNCWRPMAGWDIALSKQMAEYLCNFALCGDPNGPGLLPWKAFDMSGASVMEFGDDSVQMKHSADLRPA